jgi:hypothetical protein
MVLIEPGRGQGIRVAVQCPFNIDLGIATIRACSAALLTDPLQLFLKQ